MSWSVAGNGESSGIAQSLDTQLNFLKTDAKSVSISTPNQDAIKDNIAAIIAAACAATPGADLRIYAEGHEYSGDSGIEQLHIRLEIDLVRVADK